MTYRWKKAAANTAMIFLGVIISKTGALTDIPWSWHFWKPVLLTASSVTLFGEIRYVYAWLSTVNGEIRT